jgi:Fungal N-terminal domain of STAND proteins
MADPLSISASVAGLITIADIVIRNGYKYIKAVKNADKAVVSLMYEVNLLSGTLHSLRNVAEGFENETVPFKFTTQIHHVEYCHQTLRKINGLLDTFDPSKAKGVLQTAAQRLRWPLSISETRELMAEVERHRTTLSLALQADGL